MESANWYDTRRVLSVDHDHSCCARDNHRSFSCGKCVRSLLCKNHNTNRLSDDDTIVFAEYVKHFRSGGSLEGWMKLHQGTKVDLELSPFGAARLKNPVFMIIFKGVRKLNIMHAVELAAWVLAAAASGISLIDRKHALMWLAIAGILCNVALVLAHI